MANQGDRVDSPAEAATVQVGSDAEARDSFDVVLKRVVATSHSADLAAGTLVANRFRIEKMLGAGGMGTVYQAHDETLARSVAIKLHHAPGGAVRLRREAVAMARLAHPNVVTVFEAGEHDGHPFVVMELITGTTLRAWLAEKPRTVPEIVAIMIDAGRGLAAAHDAGLLHRDIKPENVLIGADGRARVGDFGLARDVESKEDPPLQGAALILSPLTQTGAVLGTPAYMAPEQLKSGATIDARVDQFAFCVMMWEALWKERPYQGASFEELVRALETGKRRPPPPTPRVPAKIRAALEKGLSTERGDRFTNMHGLLAALKVPVPRYAIAGGAAVAALAAGGVWFAMRPAPAPSCAHAGDELESMIPRNLSAQLRALGAMDAAKRVQADVDQFHANVAEAARESCKHRQDWSPALAAKNVACLQVVTRVSARLMSFDAITKDQITDVEHRVNLALPLYYDCTTPTTLAVAPTPPTDPKQLDALITALADVELARFDITDVHAERAAATLARVEASPMHDWPTVKTRLVLAHAMQTNAAGDYVTTAKLATEAYYAARGVDDDSVLVESLMLLLTVGTQGLDQAMVQTWVKTATADAERMTSRSAPDAGALYAFLAQFADYSGDHKSALEFVTKAHDLVRPGSEMADSLVGIHASILMSVGEIAKGEAVYDKAIADFTVRYGATHPKLASLYSDYAAALISAERYDKALELANRAVALLAASPESNDGTYIAAQKNVASALSWLGRKQETVAALEALRAYSIAHHGAHSAEVEEADTSLVTAATTLGDFAKARAMAEEALQIQLAANPDDDEVAFRLLDVASARLRAGQVKDAFDAGKRSVEVFAKRMPGTDGHRRALGVSAEAANASKDYSSALAWTAEGLAFTTPVDDKLVVARLELERAAALIATHRPSATRKLLEDARATYATQAVAERVDEIDRLLPKAQ